MAKVYLRAFEIEDYKVLTEWRNDPDIAQVLVGMIHFVSPEREKKWIENAIHNDRNDVRLAVCVGKTGKYIGNISLTSINWVNRNAEFSIFIGDKREWSKGYAYDAMRQILAYGFTQMGLQRIYLHVLEDNTKAIDLYAKAGFSKEGVLRQHVFRNGGYKNIVMMSLLKEEYERSK